MSCQQARMYVRFLARMSSNAHIPSRVRLIRDMVARAMDGSLITATDPLVVMIGKAHS